MRIDSYKHKERSLQWKESVKNIIPDISKENSDIILDYIFDMEHGFNISNKNKKGYHSFKILSKYFKNSRVSKK